MDDVWPNNVPDAPEVSAAEGTRLLEQQIESARELFSGEGQADWEVRRAWEEETETCVEMAFGRGSRPAERIVFAIRVGTRSDPSPARDHMQLQIRALEGAIRLLRVREASGDISPSPKLPTQWHEPRAAENALATSVPLESDLDLFVSHSALDVELVTALCHFLEAALKLRADKVRCTSVAGRRLPGGTHVSISLRQEIKNATVFLAVLTAASSGSDYVKAEIGARWMTERPSIILRGYGISPPSVSGPLAETHSLDLCSEADLHQLVSELGEHLSGRPEPPHAYLHQLNNVIATCKPARPGGILPDLEAVVKLLSHEAGPPATAATIEVMLGWPPDRVRRTLDCCLRENLLQQVHDGHTVTPEGLFYARVRGLL